MGFGSYDESEQDNQQIEEDDLEDAEDEDLRESEHDGDIQFEMQDTESAIERLREMQDDEEDSE